MTFPPFLPFPIQSHSKSNPPIHPKFHARFNRSALSFLVQNHTIPFPETFQSHRQSHTGFTFEERCLDTAGRPLPESQPESLHLSAMRSQVQPRNDHASLSTSFGIFHSRSNDTSFRNRVCLCNRRILPSFFFFFFFYSTVRISRERINRGSFEQLGRN